MARGKGGNAGRGSSWVRKDLRWAIYLRDEFRCLYCGIHMSQCVVTLDHLKSRSRGGSNKADNLVTCCQPCNARKKDRTPRSWYADLRKKGWPVRGIQAKIRRHTARDIRPYRAAAKAKLTE